MQVQEDEAVRSAASCIHACSCNYSRFQSLLHGDAKNSEYMVRRAILLHIAIIVDTVDIAGFERAFFNISK